MGKAAKKARTEEPDEAEAATSSAAVARVRPRRANVKPVTYAEEEWDVADDDLSDDDNIEQARKGVKGKTAKSRKRDRQHFYNPPAPAPAPAPQPQKKQQKKQQAPKRKQEVGALTPPDLR